MKNQPFFTFLLFTLLCSSCAIYRPTNVDIPLIQEKGDTRIDAGVSIFPSVTASVAHGLTDKIAVQIAGTLGANYDNHAQVALGRYFNFGDNKVVEIYGGAAYGTGEITKAGIHTLKGNYQNYFTQINYGRVANINSNFELGVGLKTGFLRTNLDDDNYYVDPSPNPPAPVNHYKDNSLLVEPTMMLRFGGEKFKFRLQGGAAFIKKLSGKDREIPQHYLNFSAGINYRL